MMKFKHLMAVCALVLAGTTASAQFNVGVKGGFAASWIKGTLIYDYENVLPHNNFYAGVSADYTFADNMILQAELLYAGKGHSDNHEIRGKYVRNLSYIQLPVYAGVKIMDDRLTFMAGPEFGYLIHASTSEYGIRFDSTDECRPFNVAIAAQMNYMIGDAFGIDLKFDWSLNRTFKDNTLIKDVQDKGKNMSVQLGVVYKFELN